MTLDRVPDIKIEDRADVGVQTDIWLERKRIEAISKDLMSLSNDSLNKVLRNLAVQRIESKFCISESIKNDFLNTDLDLSLEVRNKSKLLELKISENGIGKSYSIDIQ